MLLQEKLVNYKDKIFMCDAVEHRVINFKVIDDTLHLVTDKKWFELKASDAISWLKINFLPVADNGKQLPAEKEKLIVHSAIYDEIKGANIITTLKNNIDELKNGTLDIRKASSINQTINTMLNIVKTEITLKKLNGNEPLQ